MRQRLTTALITFAAFAGVAAPARADTFTVTETGDQGGGCQLIQPTVWQCPALRAALNLANELAGPHQINLPSGNIQLTGSELGIFEDVTITGAGARATTVSAATGERTFSILGASDVVMSGFTVAGGDAAPEDGGNFLVNATSTLRLVDMRVTGGVANRGAAISSEGTLTIERSLIDGNTASVIGGAIENEGDGESTAEVEIINSTLTRNIAPTGAAVASYGSAGNRVQLNHATVAYNTGDAFWIQHVGGTSADASIIGPNINGPAFSDGCDVSSQGAPFSSGSWNVATDSTCALNATTNRQNTDPLVAQTLTNQGGPTNVLTIPANSPAVDLVTPCNVPVDQRGVARVSAAGQPCDAGAYEYGEQQEPTPTPTPTPTTQPAQEPAPTPTPTPTPVANQTVVAEVTQGTIRYRPRGSSRFVQLTAGTAIPLGSTIDAKRGRVKIQAIPRRGRPVETAEFYAGIFRITQSGGITDLKLTEALACSKRASAAQRKPKKRRLWGDGRGRFRITGKYSAATIRGTRWLVEDRCTSTFVRVRVGVVSVRDKVRKRTVIRRAGQTYTARARRR